MPSLIVVLLKLSLSVIRLNKKKKKSSYLHSFISSHLIRRLLGSQDPGGRQLGISSSSALALDSLCD